MGKSNKTSKNFGKKSDRITPERLRRRLTYIEWVTVTSPAGVLNVQKFRGNDLYDPNVTGTGGQPEGFDEHMRFYEKFFVLGSEVVVTLCSVGTTAPTQAFEAVLVSTASGVSFTSTENASAAPFSKWAVNQGLSNDAKTLRMSMDTARIEGVPISKIRDEDNYSGSASASPVSQFDWQLLTQSVDRASTTPIYAKFEITYDVEFYGRVNLALS